MKEKGKVAWRKRSGERDRGEAEERKLTQTPFVSLLASTVADRDRHVLLKRM